VDIRRAFPHEHMILDACCVINLVASTCVEQIVSSLNTHVAIATYVQVQEILSAGGSIRSLESTGGVTDLETVAGRGVLTFESPQAGIEQTNYVNFAAFLDDGEAVTCAIGVARGWAVATDDRKPINFLRRTAPHIPVVTTLEIIKFWSEKTQSGTLELPMILSNIRRYGRYSPSRAHHLYEWWMAHIEV
jgi:hypothetical protein